MPKPTREPMSVSGAFFASMASQMTHAQRMELLRICGLKSESNIPNWSYGWSGPSEEIKAILEDRLGIPAICWTVALDDEQGARKLRALRERPETTFEKAFSELTAYTESAEAREPVPVQLEAFLGRPRVIQLEATLRGF